MSQIAWNILTWLAAVFALQDGPVAILSQVRFIYTAQNNKVASEGFTVCP